MIHQALGGNMFLTGEAGRTPIYGLGQRAYYAGGTSACIAVLAALLERRDSGRGQRVSTTVFETSAAMTSNLISQFSYSGTFPSRNRYLGYHAILECSDGWVVLFGFRSRNAVCETFGARQLIDDARFTSYDKLMEHWDEACRLWGSAQR